MENKYQITKTIRFKAEPIEINSIIKNINYISKNTDFNISNFVCDLKNYIDNCKSYVFREYNEKRKVKEKLVIKKEWLRLYAKQEYANYLTNIKKERNDILSEKNGHKNSQILITIGDIKGLPKIIIDLLDNISKLCEDLSFDADAALNERAKRAKTALLLKKLFIKNSLPCLISLIENINDKNEIGNLSILLKNNGQRLLSLLTLGIYKYLPEQSEGIVAAKASFNYYTINKKKIDYEDVKTKLNNKLVINIDEIDKLNKKNNKKDKKINIIDKAIWVLLKEDIRSRTKDSKLLYGDNPLLHCNTPSYLSLRQILKNIKSEQKKIFSEVAQSELSYDNFKECEKLYLFSDISDYEYYEYLEQTNLIKQKSNEISECKCKEKKKVFYSELQKLKQERGKLLMDKCKFKTYNKFAEFYRGIAQFHGRILTKLKGIEKECVESQMLSYWAIIIQSDNQYKLALIPREYILDCMTFLKKGKESSKRTKVYWFESFTFRSLRKLCFGNIENGTNSNTFYPEIKKELCEKYYIESKLGENKFVRGEYDFEGNDQKKIAFYKDVLCSKYAKAVLNLPIEQIEKDIISKDFKSLEDFSIALEKICYIRYMNQKNTVEKDLLSKFKAQIFTITSLDLRNADNVKNKSLVLPHDDKYHTTIWRNFWKEENEKNNYDIRLNPEISIMYRMPRQSRIDKYGKNSDKYDEKMNNRYLNEQYTIVSTFSENSNSYSKDLSFISDDEFKLSIDNFNDKIKAEDIKFSLGLDNGEAELSTIGIYLPQFKKESDKEIYAEIINTSEYGFKVVTIENLKYCEIDTNKKKRFVYNNPSYFLNKELYCHTFNKTESDYNEMYGKVFHESNVMNLDLSMAKVIDGKIISNGDLKTLLNMRCRIAQRLVYEMNDHIIKETSNKVIIKSRNDLDENEKLFFVESLYSGEKEYTDLSDEEKKDFMNWLFLEWDGKATEDKRFSDIKRNQKRNRSTYKKDDIFAISLNNNLINDMKRIFTYRKYFSTITNIDEINSEVVRYNQKTISNEELDLKINNLKNAIVGNMVGVIDFLYKHYKEKYKGDGLIIQEGFDIRKVENDFKISSSSNIYRMLERKLYQKFQNYGLVPPIKNLSLIRNDGVKDDDIVRFGIVSFVAAEGTSQCCPICKGKLNHTTRCNACNHDFSGFMNTNDGIAAFNIAKRGFENFNKQQTQ